MIKNHVEWLAKNKVDEMGTMDMTKFEYLKSNTCVGYCNVDKLGRPVYIEWLKYLKADDLFKHYSDNDMVSYYI